MKKTLTFAVFLGFLVFYSAGPAAQDLFVVDRAPNQRTIQRTNRIALANGRVLERFEGYTEIAVLLYYERQRQLLESREELEVFENGAVGRQSPYSVIFGPNAAASDVIHLQMASGLELRSHVLGLGLFDPANGNSVLLAATKESIGQLHAPRTIIYPDAFDDVAADIRYIYRKCGLSQDIILKQQIALPPGFNEATAMLEIWTEFLTPPAPDELVFQRNGLPDSSLRFGEMLIGPGKAFHLDGGVESRHSIPVFKRWLMSEQRYFLIEGLRLTAANAELARMGLAMMQPAKLPRAATFAGNLRPFPKAPALKQAKADQKIQVALAPVPPSRGLVV